MKLDLIHDIQYGFRKLTESAAYAGRVVDLGKTAEKIDLDLPFLKIHGLIALMLMDAEVTFTVVTDNGELSEKITTFLSQFTYARPVPIEEADFIYCIGNSISTGEAVLKAKMGTLIDPHLGATVIIEQEELSNQGASENGVKIQLKGPGIKEDDKKYLVIRGDDSWINARAEKNHEYPLGIECILVDQKGGLSVLPRTTQIFRGAVMFDNIQ